MSRPTPRRPATTRGSTQRPRKIAGQSPAVRSGTSDDVEQSEEPEQSEDVEQAADSTPTGSSPVSLTKAPDVSDDTEAAPDGPENPEDPEGPEDESGAAGALARPRTTMMLLTALCAIALVLAVEAAIIVTAKVTEPEADAGGVQPGVVKVPEDLPVLIDELQFRDGVETAAKAAQEIVAINYESYDAEVDAAAELMTPRFESEYRDLAAQIKDDFVATKAVSQTSVVAQGVMRANRTRLQALIFLNQVVTRTRDDKPETAITPFRVLVTMVHTDRGWLVDQLDTNTGDSGQQDKSN